MALKAILFDMDGNLLPMDQDKFVEEYFKTISQAIAPLGYEPKKLIESIIKGTFAMVNGDGTRPNEEIFWEVFCGIYGQKAKEDKPHFDRYYEENFDILKIYPFYLLLILYNTIHLFYERIRQPLYKHFCY